MHDVSINLKILTYIHNFNTILHVLYSVRLQYNKTLLLSVFFYNRLLFWVLSTKVDIR